MANAIIVIILIVSIAFGMKETVKHFNGEGACCGGSSVKPNRKKLKGKTLYTYTFQIEGMHCMNCVNDVTGAINDIEGASAKVSLNNKTALVSCDRKIDVRIIEEVIYKRGYEAELISDNNS